MPTPKPPRIQAFDLSPGRRIGRRYKVVQLLGKGVEGEVYQIVETDTEIHRAAKLYFPHRDPRQKAIIAHARKLNALRHCPIVLQYQLTEIVHVRRQPVRCLISELCDGIQLEKWVAMHRGKRLPAYRALHVLYHLVCGLEQVHALGEYHSDVHTQNILIQPVGVRFEIKLVDFFEWGKPARYKQQQDVMDSIRVLHECIGGVTHYSAAPPELKHIIANLNSRTVLRRFPTMTALRRHLEKFEWVSTIQ